MAGHVLLTRPEGKNEVLAGRLQAAGLSPLVIPALQLSPLSVLPEHLPLPSGYDLVMCVSGYAAHCYLQLLRGQRVLWPSSTFAATVGQGSARVLVRSGLVPPARVIYPSASTGNNDSEALLTRLDQTLPRLSSVLVVRGEKGREWLTTHLQARGVLVHHCVVYHRRPAVWPQAAMARLQQSYSGAWPNIVLLTSSESIDAMVLLLKPAGLLEPWLRSRFVVIHPRQAQHLKDVALEAGLDAPAVVKVCSPNDDAIFSAITALAS